MAGKAKEPEQTFWDALAAAPKGAWDEISSVASQVYHHPLDTLKSIASAPGTLNAAQMGAYHKLGLPLPVPSQFEKANDDVSKQQDYVGKYNGHLYDAIAHHPLQTAGDASMLLGGASSIAGDVLAAPRLARGLQAASDTVNPLTPVARAVGLAKNLPGVRRLADGPKVRSAAITDSRVPAQVFAHPKVQSHFNQVVSEKGAAPATARESVLRAAGVDPDIAPITRGATTGSQVPNVKGARADIKSRAKEADSLAHDAINQQTASLAPQVDPTDIGRDFIDNYKAAKDNVKAGYRKAFSNDGAFHPDALEDLPKYVSDALTAGEKTGGPSSIGAFRKAPNTHEQTNQALFGRPAVFDAQGNVIEEARPSIFQGLQDTAQENGGLSLGDIEMHRRELDSLIGKAQNGTDIGALTSLKDGLDNWIAETAPDATKFTGNGDDLAVDMANARRGYHEYRKTYFDSAANPSVVRARAAIDPKGFLDPAEIAPDGRDVSTVTDHLTKDIVDPKSGTLSPKTATSSAKNGMDTYADLTADPTPMGYSALTPEGRAALNEHIRSKFFRPDMGTSDIEDALSSPFARVLKDGDAENLRLQAAGHDILDQPRFNKSDITAGAPSTLKQLGVGALTEGAALLGEHGLNGVLPGAGTVAKWGAGFAGSGLERAREVRNAKNGVEQELSGAPTTYKTTDEQPLARAAVVANAAVPAQQDQAPAAAAPPVDPDVARLGLHEINPDTPPSQGAAPKDDVERLGLHEINPDATPRAAGGRTGYARGGSVNPHTVERLVNRLIKRVKQAKKETDKTTEPLLQQDDATVAKALAIAKKGI